MIKVQVQITFENVEFVRGGHRIEATKLTVTIDKAKEKLLYGFEPPRYIWNQNPKVTTDSSHITYEYERRDLFLSNFESEMEYVKAEIRRRIENLLRENKKQLALEGTHRLSFEIAAGEDDEEE